MKVCFREGVTKKNSGIFQFVRGRGEGLLDFQSSVLMVPHRTDNGTLYKIILIVYLWRKFFKTMVFIVIPDKENMTFRQSVLLLSVLLCPNRLSLIVNLIKILRRHSPDH